ncbi:hypothetical protein [Andreprevotia sp. IGB-42]|uniref:hypothetical protein n=1 Tax=Andreprevotia sp. IGB-42 TaxID=2497473 RepID=UPI00135ABA3A|nr:hypothetical protein [Andreprevotia sp. IGB-42]
MALHRPTRGNKVVSFLKARKFFFLFTLFVVGFAYFTFAVVPKERLRTATSQAVSICREIAIGRNGCANFEVFTELKDRPEDPWGNYFRCKQGESGNVVVFSRDYNVYDSGGRAQVVCTSEGKQMKNSCFCKVDRL